MEYFDFLMVAIVWLFAGFINGLSGMGAAMIAVPVLSLVLDMQTNIAISCILIPIMSAMLAWKMRQYCEPQLVLPILLGAIPGSIVGTYILKYVPTLYLQITMAVVLTSYTIWALMQKNTDLEHKDNKIIIFIAGFIAGITGSSLSFFAPPLAIYVIYAGWPPTKTMGTLCISYVIMSFISCVFQAIAGLYTVKVIALSLVAIPVSMIGTVIAFPIIKYLVPKTFRMILLVVIALSGIMSGLRALSTLAIF